MGRRGEESANRMSLTWKLVLGFLFALVLQIAQMLISGYFTARMQAASVLVSNAMSANLAVQAGIDAVRQLRGRIETDREAGARTVDVAVYRVYLDAVGEQSNALAQALRDVAGGRFAAVDETLATARGELRGLEAAIAGGAATAQPVTDALDFLDDAIGETEQALLRSQIEVRAIAADGVEQERRVHDLPLRAGLAITLAGIVLMAGFVAWFSRQLVVPIRRAWSELERRVAERTTELASTVEQLEGEIAERKRAERQKEELHRQLVDSSRRAGMAELANGVLHNVGNVLNSVNVGTNLLRDRLRSSKVAGLQRVVSLLREHEHDLAEFLANTPQGGKVPHYLEQLSAHLRQEHGELLGEADGLAQRVDVLKEIVSRQQSYARVHGQTQPALLSVIVDDVLRMHATSFTDLDIRVEKDFAWDEECEVDRSRVLQILMNLVANAKQALRERGRGGAVLRITTALAPEGRVRLAVQDNGVGIAPENIARIFAHGFTTKRDGHGFGLHHSANAASEMGGRLSAASAGTGQGATFVLELPIRGARTTTESASNDTAATAAC